jgi:hypothetical protein
VRTLPGAERGKHGPWLLEAASLPSAKVATSNVRDPLLRLREQIPGLLGEDDWNAVRESATAVLRELEDAGTPAEQQMAIDALLAVLMPYPVLAEPLRRALRGSGTRGQVTDGGGRGQQPRGLEPRDSDDDAHRGIGGIGGIGEPDVVRNERTLRRWPHMDVDHPGPVPAGTELQVSVYVDTSAPRFGEIAKPLVVPEAAEIRIRVVLVASERHFEVGGAAADWIVIRGGEARSTTATFRLRVAAGVEGPGEITAFLVYEGRPAGAVTRSVSVRAAARALQAPSAREPLGTDVAIRADLAARRPDLTVQIMAVPNTGQKRYRCSVSTPHLPQYAEGIEQDWGIISSQGTNGSWETT